MLSASYTLCLLPLLAAAHASDLYDLPLGLIVTDRKQGGGGGSGSGGALSAITLALTQQHREQTPIQFNVSADRISTVDAYKLSKLICRQFDRGVVALMGVVDPESFDTLHSYANAFEMPFVTPWFPETAYGLTGSGGILVGDGGVGGGTAGKDGAEGGADFAMQIRPDYHEGIIDIITYYGWDKIIYIYRLV